MDRLDVCTRAADAVYGVGNYLHGHWGKVRDVDHSVKDHPTDFDVVTVHDHWAEDRLRTGLTAIDSGLGFTGEEGGCHRGGDSYWLVDPIDGTDAFIRGLPFCTVQVALIEAGVVTIGIIYDFIRKEMVFSIKDMGTRCNGQEAHVSNRDLRTGRMIIEIDVRNNPEHQRIMIGMRERGTLLQCCASGWELLQIACGRIEGKVTYKPWAIPLDLAAGHLLVREAGGSVTNIGRTDYDFCNTDVVAGNKVVHQELTTGPNALFPLN